MDWLTPQAVINGLMGGIFVVLLSWSKGVTLSNARLKEKFDEYKDAVSKEMKILSLEISKLETKVANEFTHKNDFGKLSDAITELTRAMTSRFDRVEDKIDKKADKQ